jgi:hypothetical protein
MPEYKNQHYVPKHLLRGWTGDERVPVYNLGNQEEYPPTNLSNLCSEDYFYGGPEAEKSMDALESRHAEIINRIRSKMSFGVLDKMDILHFCTFILLQRNRTKQRKQEAEDLIDNLGREYLKVQIEAGEIDPELPGGGNVLDVLDDYKITSEKPLAYPMLNALTGVDLIIDLDAVVIVNETDEEFVVSDHPVVHDNPRFKDQLDRFLIGVQNRGLQIFVPLSHKVQIMLYDPVAYDVEYSDKKRRGVLTTSEKVVASLNNLQMINAFENIFYRTSNQEQKYIDAQEQISEYIEEENTVFMRKESDEHDFDTENEIIESGYRLVDYSPSLPFVTQRKDVQFRIERRPNVRQSHKKHVNKLLEDARKEEEATD